MTKTITRWFICGFVSLIVLAQGCDNSNSGGGGFGGGGGIFGSSVYVSVTEVPDGDACEDNLYAVSFADFDTRSGESQVQLTSTGSNSYGGTLTLNQAHSQTIYVYCDSSQGDFSYDDDPIGAINLVDYSNSGVFNACGRSIVPTPGQYGTSLTTYSPYTLTNYFVFGTVPGGVIYDLFDFNPQGIVGLFQEGYKPGAVDPVVPFANGGDAFAVRLVESGDQVNVAFTSLVALSDTPHPDNGGSAREWCNCILGPNHTVTFGLTTVTGPSNTSAFYYLLDLFTNTNTTSSATNPFSLGYFTDTNRDTHGGSCILP